MIKNELKKLIIKKKWVNIRIRPTFLNIFFHTSTGVSSVLARRFWAFSLATITVQNFSRALLPGNEQFDAKLSGILKRLHHCSQTRPRRLGLIRKGPLKEKVLRLLRLYHHLQRDRLVHHHRARKIESFHGDELGIDDADGEDALEPADVIHRCDREIVYARVGEEHFETAGGADYGLGVGQTVGQDEMVVSALVDAHPDVDNTVDVDQGFTVHFQAFQDSYCGNNSRIQVQWTAVE